MLKNYYILFACALLISTNAAARETSEKDFYRECSPLAAESPKKALGLAEKQLAASASVSAYHCKAMALFNLGQYKTAAETLDKISVSLDAKKGYLWLKVTEQSATAWGYTGEFDKAEAKIRKGLLYANQTGQSKAVIDLLHARADISAQRGKHLQVVNDMDNVLALDGKDTDALMKRADAFMALGKQELAWKDLTSILKLDPTNKDAKAKLSGLNVR